MNPHTTAERMRTKYGTLDAFWLAMRHVRFHRINPGNERALAFWRCIRDDLYLNIGKTEMWS